MFNAQQSAKAIRQTYIDLRKPHGLVPAAKELDDRAQALYVEGNYVAAEYWWVQAIRALPVMVNVVVGSKNNGNGNDRREAKKAARFTARQTNAATLQMALTGARQVVENGMPQVDQNAVRALRAQWYAQNAPAVQKPKKTMVTKHGGKQRGKNRREGVPMSPREAMAKQLIVALA